MGDMADLLLSQAEYDEGYFDNVMYCETTNSHIGPGRTVKIPSCKFCGKSPLHWKKLGNQWILHEMCGEHHDCPKKTLPVKSLKLIMERKITKSRGEELLDIPSWDMQFMHDVYWWARRSKDNRTKLGAVLVKWDDKIPISMAYNGFPRKVNDNVASRWERPEKYEWVAHAEDNAVLNCARRGYSSFGTVLYTQGIPCSRCADACIQGGIAEIVVHKQWQDYEKKFGWDKWIDSARRSQEKFKEANIPIRVFDGQLGMVGVLDGKIINV